MRNLAIFTFGPFPEDLYRMVPWEMSNSSKTATASGGISLFWSAWIRWSFQDHKYTDEPYLWTCHYTAVFIDQRIRSSGSIQIFKRRTESMNCQVPHLIWISIRNLSAHGSFTPFRNPLVFFLSFWRTHVLIWGHWYPCFGFLLWVSKPEWVLPYLLFAEANVMYIPWDPPLVLHMLTSWWPASPPVLFLLYLEFVSW